MFTENEQVMSFVASGDLRTCINRVVSLLTNANFKVGLGTANTGFGVLLNAPNDGEHASVVVEGVTMVKVGVAVQAGNDLSNAGSGWANVAAVTAGVQHVIGKALTSAASGMLCSVKLERFYLPNSIA